jgi:hypothetical protein
MQHHFSGEEKTQTNVLLPEIIPSVYFSELLSHNLLYSYSGHLDYKSM